MTNKKSLYVDIETTGLEAGVHVPLSIGMLLYDEDDNLVDVHVETICPTKEQFDAANPDALKVNGFTWEKLQEEGVPAEAAVANICTWLYDNDVNAYTTEYIGQNPRFDVRFLQVLMGEQLAWLGFPLDNPTDTIALAKELAQKDPTIRFENFKGWGIARALGVDEEDALHTALGGVNAVRRNHVAIKERLNNLKKG